MSGVLNRDLALLDSNLVLVVRAEADRNNSVVRTNRNTCRNRVERIDLERQFAVEYRNRNDVGYCRNDRQFEIRSAVTFVSRTIHVRVVFRRTRSRQLVSGEVEAIADIGHIVGADGVYVCFRRGTLFHLIAIITVLTVTYREERVVFAHLCTLLDREVVIYFDISKQQFAIINSGVDCYRVVREDEQDERNNAVATLLGTDGVLITFVRVHCRQ